VGIKSTVTYSGDIKQISQIAKAKNSFVNNCNNLITKSYFELIKLQYSTSWDEETFSANVRNILKVIIKKNKLAYFVNRENIEDNEDILSGKVNAKTAKKIDIYFATFQSNKYLEYAIEAKILVENNFNSKNFSYLNAQYIDEGMDRFINNIYKVKGCMLGYVIEGNPDKIVAKINKILLSRNRDLEIIGNKHKMNNLKFCYTSIHPKISLLHFFFPLN